MEPEDLECPNGPGPPGKHPLFLHADPITATVMYLRHVMCIYCHSLTTSSIFHLILTLALNGKPMLAQNAGSSLQKIQARGFKRKCLRVIALMEHLTISTGSGQQCIIRVMALFKDFLSAAAWALVFLKLNVTTALRFCRLTNRIAA